MYISRHFLIDCLQKTKEGIFHGKLEKKILDKYVVWWALCINLELVPTPLQLRKGGTKRYLWVKESVPIVFQNR